jgi:hypothetical protein
MSSLLTTGFLLLKRLSISAQRSLQGPNNSFERSLGRKPRNAPEPRDTATVARVVQVSMEQLLATRCSITREAERAIVESKAMLCLRRRPANYCLEDPLGRYVSAGRLRQRFQTSFFGSDNCAAWSSFGRVFLFFCVVVSSSPSSCRLITIHIYDTVTVHPFSSSTEFLRKNMEFNGLIMTESGR